MTTEDLQGQVARSAAVERELREQVEKLRGRLAAAIAGAEKQVKIIKDADARLNAATARATAAERERDGLIRQRDYEWDRRKKAQAARAAAESALVEARGALLDRRALCVSLGRTEIEPAVVIKWLDAAVAALARAGERETPKCTCRRTETYIENRGNCPEHPAPSRFPDHNSAAGPIWRDRITAPAGEPASGGQEEFVGNGVSLIAAERQRQIEKEGWTPEHDDEHAGGELALAAACYANPTRGVSFPPNAWPWAPSWWKPSPTNRVRELAKAGALIAAEIDRLLRAAPEWYATPPPGEQGKGGGEGLALARIKELLETLPAPTGHLLAQIYEIARLAPAQPAEHPAPLGCLGCEAEAHPEMDGAAEWVGFHEPAFCKKPHPASGGEEK